MGLSCCLSVSVCPPNFLLGGLRDRLALCVCVCVCVSPKFCVFCAVCVVTGMLMRTPCCLRACVSPIFSFPKASVSYQRKVGDYFFPVYIVNMSENVSIT
jgi:hypothetical protein